MRESKKLAEKHSKPVLAKIYRAYISELIAVFRNNPNSREISIEGDCVWGIFDTPSKADIDTTFSTASQAASLIDILNYKLSKKGISKINIGIGISYGNSLMIKSGYKGSGVNEVTWMGTLVAEAAKLCSYGNRSFSDHEIMVSKVFFYNLNDQNKSLLKYHSTYDCYHGNVIATLMNNWLKQQV